MDQANLPPVDHSDQLKSTITELFAGQKGILAADESTGSANKRLAALNILQDKETRRKWRQLLLTTHNIQDFLSGVILFDETFHQKTDAGSTFPEELLSQGVIPGIKVDTGLVELTNFAPEEITEGLDGLNTRLADYYRRGARFAKWRAAFNITSSTPSEAAVHANGNAFGRYASLCQANGIVPIIEPEIIYDGNHDLTVAEETTSRVLKTTLEIVKAYRVNLSGIIVKTSMVLAGKQNRVQSNPDEVASATVGVLKASVPSDVGGVIFLSGGQNPIQATENLNAIAKLGRQPWPITFSFSRAVQDPVMKLWAGKAENIQKAQAVFYHRLACNNAARAGQYNPKMEIF